MVRVIIIVVCHKKLASLYSMMHHQVSTQFGGVNPFAKSISQWHTQEASRRSSPTGSSSRSLERLVQPLTGTCRWGSATGPLSSSWGRRGLHTCDKTRLVAGRTERRINGECCNYRLSIVIIPGLVPVFFGIRNLDFS